MAEKTPRAVVRLCRSGESVHRTVSARGRWETSAIAAPCASVIAAPCSRALFRFVRFLVNPPPVPPGHALHEGQQLPPEGALQRHQEREPYLVLAGRARHAALSVCLQDVSLRLWRRPMTCRGRDVTRLPRI